jgi:hypothetical protein
MVLSVSGRCSFCGKDAREVFGVAGVMSHPARVCNECIAICFEIMGDSFTPPPPPAERLVRNGSSDAFDFEPIGLMRNSMTPRTSAELKALIEQARKLLDQPEPARRRGDELSCSFCDRKHHEVVKLIAGPQVCICDVCIFDAAALISMHS